MSIYRSQNRVDAPVRFDIDIAKKVFQDFSLDFFWGKFFKAVMPFITSMKSNALKVHSSSFLSDRGQADVLSIDNHRVPLTLSDGQTIDYRSLLLPLIDNTDGTLRRRI